MVRDIQERELDPSAIAVLPEQQMSVESSSFRLNADDLQDWTINVGSTKVGIVALSAPLQAEKPEPAFFEMTTGQPVIAACRWGSRYAAKRASAGAANPTDCLMMLRMRYLELWLLFQPDVVPRPVPIAGSGNGAFDVLGKHLSLRDECLGRGADGRRVSGA